MTGERKKLGFEILIGKLKKNIGKLFITNLLFAFPLGIGIATGWLLDSFLHYPIVIYPAAFVIAAPFYPGVVVIARDLSEGKFEGGIFSRFVEAVKESWLKYLISGVLFYLVFEMCFFGISLYIGFGRAYSWIFYLPMFFSILISVFFLFFFLSAFLMISSFDLKLKAVFKNSALATFGEVKNNFFSVVAIVAYLAVTALPFVIISYLIGVLPYTVIYILLISYLLIDVLLLIPAPCSLIISHYLYPNMLRVIGGVDTKEEVSKEKKIEKVKEDIKEEIVNNEGDMEKLIQGSDDDYIFYNGKMIKRGTLKKMYNESKEVNKNEE